MITAERIAEIRAAWRADRSERWESFRRQWPMHVWELVCDTGFGVMLGFALGLSLLLWVLEVMQ